MNKILLSLLVSGVFFGGIQGASAMDKIEIEIINLCSSKLRVPPPTRPAPTAFRNAEKRTPTQPHIIDLCSPKKDAKIRRVPRARFGSEQVYVLRQDYSFVPVQTTQLTLTAFKNTEEPTIRIKVQLTGVEKYVLTNEGVFHPVEFGDRSNHLSLPRLKKSGDPISPFLGGEHFTDEEIVTAFVNADVVTAEPVIDAEPVVEAIQVITANVASRRRSNKDATSGKVAKPRRETKGDDSEYTPKLRKKNKVAKSNAPVFSNTRSSKKDAPAHRTRSQKPR